MTLDIMNKMQLVSILEIETIGLRWNKINLSTIELIESQSKRVFICVKIASLSFWFENHKYDLLVQE